MGLMGRVIGAGRAAERIGGAVTGVAEVFVGNAAERDRADLERVKGTLDQFTGEFEQTPETGYDRFVNALNRLPRPMLALGTLSLFIYAMADPGGFAFRMEGLNLVPDPLWWLLGAIVSFYFGARELHHFRASQQTTFTRARVAGPVLPVSAEGSDEGISAGQTASSQTAPLLGPLFSSISFGNSGLEPAVEVRASDPDFNAAIEEWRIRTSRG